MRSRGNSPSIIASPILVGAVTVLVAVVAVFLSYNANSGLPFVPTYQIKVQLPDAAELVKGNDVRIGGTRAGVVEKVSAVERRGGVVIAELTLKLDKEFEPLPDDTTALVRQRSNLGLKYLELTPGRSKTTLAGGQTLPLRQAEAAVSLDEALGVFDARTRAGLRGMSTSLSYGVAGRGQDFNRTLAALPEALALLEPVARNLAAPATDLDGAIRGVSSTVSAISPVANELMSLLDAGAQTFDAIAAERDSLEAALAEAPVTERESTQSLRAIRPVLVDTSELLRDLRPGVESVRPATARLASALDAAPALLDTVPGLSDDLEGTLVGLEDLATDPMTIPTVDNLGAAVPTAIKLLEFVNPTQTVCNYGGLWTRNIPSLVSEGDSQGTWFRFTPIIDPAKMLPASVPAPDLKYAPYPDAGQNGECEAGNEPFTPRQVIGTVPGRQPNYTEKTRPVQQASDR